MRPPVLLMDEVFSALDPSTRASLQTLIREMWQELKPTVVFVTHNTSEALLLGTRLIVLGHCNEGQSLQSNVLLDRNLPLSSEPLSLRKRRPEFQELREQIKRVAYGLGPSVVDGQRETGRHPPTRDR
jgi:NitT/TauT family transport system ATP-binding protein